MNTPVPLMGDSRSTEAEITARTQRAIRALRSALPTSRQHRILTLAELAIPRMAYQRAGESRMGIRRPPRVQTSRSTWVLLLDDVAALLRAYWRVFEAGEVDPWRAAIEKVEARSGPRQPLKSPAPQADVAIPPPPPHDPTVRTRAGQPKRRKR